jgi:hypothetical protein
VVFVVVVGDTSRTLECDAKAGVANRVMDSNDQKVIAVGQQTTTDERQSEGESERVRVSVRG